MLCTCHSSLRSLGGTTPINNSATVLVTTPNMFIPPWSSSHLLHASPMLFLKVPLCSLESCLLFFSTFNAGSGNLQHSPTGSAQAALERPQGITTPSLSQYRSQVWSGECSTVKTFLWCEVAFPPNISQNKGGQILCSRTTLNL